jgi:hypothetical protein
VGSRFGADSHASGANLTFDALWKGANSRKPSGHGGIICLILSTSGLEEGEGSNRRSPRKRDNGFRYCPVRSLRLLPFRERDRVVL